MSNLALMTKVLAKYLIPGSHFVANNFFKICLTNYDARRPVKELKKIANVSKLAKFDC